MPVPFKVIKQEPESIYDRKVVLEMSEADYLTLRYYAHYYAADLHHDAAAAKQAAVRFVNSYPEGYYNLDPSKLFGGEVFPLNDAEKADVRDGHGLSAIKSYRMRNSVSLKEAKDIVDAYRATL